MQPLPRQRLTQRQKVARAFGICDRQLTRWIRFIESNSLDWVRCNPDGATTPRFLHPYQEWLLRQVLYHRVMGRQWLEPILLHGSQWNYQNWLQTTQNTANKAT